MAKSIKLQNDTYWDSTGIVHRKKILDTRLQELRQYQEASGQRTFPITDNPNRFCPLIITYSSNTPITINNTQFAYDNTRVEGFCIQSDSGLVGFQIGCITYSDNSGLRGKIIYRYVHGAFGSKENWISLN